MCYEFEARNLLLVLGEYIWQRQVIPPAEQWKIGVETTRQAGDYACELGLEIAMELEPFKLSLLNSVDKVLILRAGRAEAFGSPNDVLHRLVRAPARPDADKPEQPRRIESSVPEGDQRGRTA
jgi:hypothetical protein